MSNYSIPCNDNYIAPKSEPTEDDLVNLVLSDNIDLLRKILIDISFDINRREELKNDLIYSIDKNMCGITGKLLDIDSWALGYNRTIDLRRNHLEKKLIELRKEKRDRETEKWRDTALLKKEFRAAFKEYKKAQRRLNLIARMNQ